MIRLSSLITIIACYSLFSCHSSDQYSRSQANLSLQNKAMLDFMDIEYESMKRRTERRLNDPAKYEFLPLLPALEKLELEIEKILSELNKVRTAVVQKNKVSQSTEFFIRVTDSSLHNIVDIHSSLLDQYGEIPFGLKETEIEEMLVQFSDTLKADLNDWKINNLTLLSSQYAQQSLGNLEWKIRLLQFKQYQYFVSFSDFRSTGSHWYYYPVISPKKCIVKTNEAFIADVSIGTYAAVDPQYFELFVNGNLIKANNSGIAELNISPTSKIGTKNLQLKAIIYNPYNYESYSFESTFEYEVIKK